MYRYPILFIISCFVVNIAVAQKLQVKVIYTDGKKDDALIYYSPKKLSWNDFTGSPNMSSDAAAITSAGFGFGAGFKRVDDKAELTITVNCNFNKTKSWVKESGRTAYILNHEQHHFDISYISTMLFVQKLKEAHFTMDNYKTLLPSIYNQCVQNMSDLQEKYDTETSNGRIKDKQEEWNKKIATQLSSLNSAIAATN